MVRRLLYSSLFPADRAVLFVAKHLNVNLELKEVESVGGVQFKYFKDHYFNHPTPHLQYDVTKLQTGPAISGFLVNIYDKDNKLYPKDAKKRALIDEALHFNSAVLVTKAYQAITTLLSGERTTVSRPLRNEIGRIYDKLEYSMTTPWLVGNQVSLADLNCIPSITTIELISNVSKDEYPKLHRYLENAKNVPHYMEANQDGLNKLTKLILEKLEKMRQKTTCFT